MREIKVGDEVIITDVRNVLGNNDKTSDSVEEYMAKVASITHDVDGDVWYECKLYECKLAVINKTLMFPQWEVFLMDKTTNDIKVHDTVWVDMSNWSDTPPHESGYAVVDDFWGVPVMYAVKFRGSDDVIIVNGRRVTPIHEEKDKKVYPMHDKHYRNAVVEPILVMQALFSRDEFIGFLKGNILKYRLRAGHKGGEIEMKCELDKIHVYEMWLDTIKNGERIVL